MNGYTGKNVQTFRKKNDEIIENIYDPMKKTINGTFCYSNINKYESYDEKALTVYMNCMNM